MNKLNRYVLIVAMLASTSAAAEAAVGPGLGAEFSACKLALERHFKLPRRVHVYSTYWISGHAKGEKRVLVNAKFGKKSVRGTCAVSAKGRAVDLAVAPVAS